MVFVSYDRTGNVLTADYAGEQTETNTYNELGLLTTVTTAEGDTLYQYDDASRLLSVTQPNGETVSYTYDSHGNRATMTYPNGKTVKYTYDDMNRLIAVKGIDGETTKYEYDALGRRIATDGAKEDTVYTYDEVGNLVSQTTTGAYDLALEYAYDLSGRMTSESRTENGATLTSSYIYDALGQLTSFTRSDGQSETYTYDPVGNMTAKTQNGVSTAMRYNAANQLISSVSGTDRTTYTYDANGNLTRSENAGGARSYAYNALNLLQSFTREDGYTETYTYNANRLLSTIKTSEDLTTTLTWDILYGDGVVISAAQNGQTTNYTYGVERISAISGSTRTEYVYDGRGSVAAEVSYNNAWYTFGGGLARKTVTSKSYTPFGEQIGETVSGFGYNGEYYNAATGMIYLRARFYAPEMNRFGQKDTLRGNIADGISLNRYLYCQSDPVNFADYNGLQMVNVCVADGGGGGSFRNSQTYKSFLAEGQGLANEAKQNMRQAELAWHQAEAYAPGSQAANAAMNAWKQAKSAAARASTNLSKLQSAGSLSAANTYIANIRSAASTARNAANEARTCADRAARNRTGGQANPTRSLEDIPEVEMMEALTVSCAGSKTVTRVGNNLVYNGKIYTIPQNSPIVNWTAYDIERYLMSPSDRMRLYNTNNSAYQEIEPSFSDKALIIIFAAANSIEIEFALGVGLGGEVSVGPASLSAESSFNYLDVSIVEGKISNSITEKEKLLFLFQPFYAGFDHTDYSTYYSNEVLYSDDGYNEYGERDLVIGPSASVYAWIIGGSARVQFNVNTFIEYIERFSD